MKDRSGRRLQIDKIVIKEQGILRTLICPNLKPSAT